MQDNQSGSGKREAHESFPSSLQDRTGQYQAWVWEPRKWELPGQIELSQALPAAVAAPDRPREGPVEDAAIKGAREIEQGSALH